MTSSGPQIVSGLKRGTLYGAAVGMIVGFLFQLFATVAPGREIALWRDFILVGAAAGCGAGFIVAVVRRGKSGPPDGSRDVGIDKRPE